jgi:hypothetical protein
MFNKDRHTAKVNLKKPIRKHKPKTGLFYYKTKQEREKGSKSERERKKEKKEVIVKE